MSLFVYSAAGSTIGFSGLSFKDAKTRVARILGGDPEELGAGDAIRAAIDKWNETEWDYLAVIGSGVTITDGIGTLPTPFKKPVALRWNDRPLPYIRMSDWDHTVMQVSAGEPRGYTLFNAQTSGQIRLLPTSGSGTVGIKYFRPVAKPTGDFDTLDILDWMETAVILEAQTQLYLEHGDKVATLEMLQGRAERAYRAVLGNDRSIGPTEDTMVLAHDGWGTRTWPVDHAQNWIRDGEG